MNRTLIIPKLALIAALSVVALSLLAASASAQATRTWVSGVGDDANPCSRTAPCKTFAGAISKTAVGGEIDALDPGGFGNVTITKSITIDGNGFGSILNTSKINGLIVNPGVDGDVVVRNLTINGAATSGFCPAFGGGSGVRVLGGRSLRLDNVSIQNQNIGVEAPVTNVSSDIYFDLTINNSNVFGSCDSGINLTPDAGKRVRSVIKNSAISNANTALKAGAGAEVWSSQSSYSLNNAGVDLTGGGVFTDLGGSFAVGNADGKGLPTPPAAPIFCKVPKITGKTRSAAGSALSAAACKLGKTTYKKVSKKQKKSKGKVLAQAIPSGIEVKAGTAVSVTVGK